VEFTEDDATKLDLSKEMVKKGEEELLEINTRFEEMK